MLIIVALGCQRLNLKGHCKPYEHFESPKIHFHIVLDLNHFKLNKENVAPIFYFLFFLKLKLLFLK